ncbi:TLC domain-containing protein 4-B [Impatiens glandulifera]|uniref:TLC domain-containing protein 4-B n=1 Tax=Impatiens glandulifera TaxID=253017 RepID=UPI001FB13261|nr:TLC domain-containing protein 4-B [Impatiens glandulifera]XP_047312233.1 TLC domain-containing protein 4-B [Impatiens glandulifera]
MTIAGYDVFPVDLHWLPSAFAGVLICKIVYELTGVLSSMFITGYKKLNDVKKLEWNNRGISTFHALLVAAAAFYLFLVSDLFSENSDQGLIVNRRSDLSDRILGISIGYFISDLGMIIWKFPALGGLEYVVHHGLSMFSIFLSLLSGQGQIYILMVLFTETTTPFVNLRWYLDNLGLKNSSLYIWNGVALFFGWLVARILLLIFFFYHMFRHFDQVKTIFPLGFYSLLIVPSVLSMMNLFWFWKITKGMVKTLTKSRHTR